MNTENTVSEYDQQAADFLAANGLKLRVTLSNTKLANWTPSGDHFRVTISGKARRLTFDFWGSVRDMEEGKAPSAYSVLACISSDAYTRETFAGFCGEYDYEEDSIKALQTFRRASAFAKRLRAFFSEAELSQLAKIN